MRFTRLVKVIECGTPIEKIGTPSQGGPEKITETSKKRKKTMVDSDDSAMNQNDLLKTDQLASTAEKFADDSDDDNIARDKSDDIPAAKKSTMPPAKKAAISKSKIGISKLATSGMNTSEPVASESEPHSPKVGTHVSCFRVAH